MYKKLLYKIKFVQNKPVQQNTVLLQKHPVNWIGYIRQQHQLSVADLAMFLRVSTNLVYKAEAGSRNLSAAATTKLLAMHQQFQQIRQSKKQSDTIMPGTQAHAREHTQKKLERNVFQSRERLMKYEQRIEHMKRLHQAAGNMLCIVSTIREEQQQESDPLQKSWMDGMEAAAWLQLYKYSQADILLLEIKTAGLRAQIKAAENILTQFSYNPYR